MEDTDLRILSALEENARVSFTDLAKKIGVSSASVADRVRRLEGSGTIVGYRAIVDPVKTGTAVRAYVRISAPQSHFADLIALARATPEVKEAHHTEGKSSFLLLVVASTRAELDRVVSLFAPFGRTETSILIAKPVEKLTL
jgi:Lrp/AsnC family leucine-responsive transcriptional regulator